MNSPAPAQTVSKHGAVIPTEVEKSLKLAETDPSAALGMTKQAALPPNRRAGAGEGTRECFGLSEEMTLRHILKNLLHNAITYSERGGKVEIKIESSIKYNVLSGESASESMGKLSKAALTKNPPLPPFEKGGSTHPLSPCPPANTAGTPLRKEGNCVVWSVRDNGIGIPKKSQKSLFEKFKRGKNANKMNTDGSGLGLFIVKKLVSAHPGAEVGFTSKEGAGSEFWVRFWVA